MPKAVKESSALEEGTIGSQSPDMQDRRQPDDNLEVHVENPNGASGRKMSVVSSFLKKGFASREQVENEDDEVATEKAKANNYGAVVLSQDSLMKPTPIDQMGGKVSASSYSNASSVNSKYPNAREISETLNTKFYEIATILISVGINIALIVFFQYLGKGLEMPFGLDTLNQVGSIFIIVVLLISNIMTLMALNDGAAAYFGNLLTAGHGYSLAVCGFFQTSSVFKIQYCNQLSLNSTCRKFLAKLAFVWIVLEALKLLTILPATGLSGTTLRLDKGTIACIEFGQNNAPTDRKWPTIEVQAGIAELIFGTAIGYVRSERADISVTTAIMTPQIVGAVNDGDTIVGSGFTTDLLTTCVCTPDNTVESIQKYISDGSLDSATKLLKSYTDLDKEFGIASYIDATTNATTNVFINSIVSGSKVCGGRKENVYLTMCKTAINNHKTAKIVISYMTDGTPASIAAKSAEVREYTGDADLTWVASAMTSIHEGTYSSFRLPSNIPGVLACLFWWTTPNLLTIDPSLLEAGLETYFTILLRAAMQRVYSVKGNSCITNIANVTQSVAILSSDSVVIAIVILSFQLLANLISLAAFIPWFLSSKPAGPGVRCVKDHVYFLTLVNSSGIIPGFAELCNAPNFTIWQTVDTVVRIGETLETRGDVVGHITMDKPKMVRSMVNGKKYY